METESGCRAAFVCVEGHPTLDGAKARNAEGTVAHRATQRPHPSELELSVKPKGDNNSKKSAEDHG
jgi:hypothetical protein